MKPQERHAAIFACRAEPGMKVLLMAVSHFLTDDGGQCFASPETLADMTGQSVSTVKALLSEAVTLAILRRWEGGYRTKHMTIDWEALAALAPKPSARGGVRVKQGSDVRTDESDNRTVPSDNRPMGSDNWTPAVRCSDPCPSDNRTQTGSTSGDSTRNLTGESKTIGTAPAAPVVSHPESERVEPAVVAEVIIPKSPTRTPKASPTLMPCLLPDLAATVPDKQTKGGKVFGHRGCIEAFEEEWQAAFGHGAKVPWRWSGRDPDGASVTQWCKVADIKENDIAGGVNRVRGAARAYFRAVNAGTAFPIGDPATVRWFTKHLDKWLQIDPNANPAPAGRRDDRTESMAILARLAQGGS